MIVKRFQREDIAALKVQPRQLPAMALVTDEALTLMESGPAYTLHGDEPLACAGIIAGPVPVAWAMLSEKAPMIALHRYILAALSVFPYCIAYAAKDWPTAGRWLRMLGFQPTEVTEVMGGVPYGMFERHG